MWLAMSQPFGLKEALFNDWVFPSGNLGRPPAQHYDSAADELDIPLNTLEGQVMLGARDLIAEEAFTEVSECQS